MRRFQISVDELTFERLAELAHTENRSVKGQAAYLLKKALTVSDTASQFNVVARIEQNSAENSR